MQQLSGELYNLRIVWLNTRSDAASGKKQPGPGIGMGKAGMQSTPQKNETQTMSLVGKRILAFCVFGGIAGVSGYLCLVIPLSILAVRGDPTGSGSGYAIFGFIILGPIAAAPGVLIGGLAALPIIDRALKATARSRADYLRFVLAIAASALLGIGTAWLLAWLAGNYLFQ